MHLEQKFTPTLRRPSRPESRRINTQPTALSLDLHHNTTLEKSTSSTLKSNSTIMGRVRDFWKPSSGLRSGGATSNTLSKAFTRVRAGRSRKQSEADNTSNLINTYDGSSRSNSHTAFSSGFATVDSVNEPISALDCPQTTNARRIEQQAQRMIMSSFSPVDENLNNRNPNCHRCLTWQCKRSYNNTAPGLNTTGQVSGNLKTPKGAEHIITESDDSLVHVEMGSPQVDFSLLRQAAHDLRALDATLLQKSQSRQLGTSSRSGCITSAEEDGYSCGKKESVPVEDTGIGEFDDLEILFAMDEESEFEFPGLDYALATDPDECPQMKYVSQRSAIISEAPKNLVQAQQGEMDYIEEKVLGMGLSEDESLV